MSVRNLAARLSARSRGALVILVAAIAASCSSDEITEVPTADDPSFASSSISSNTVTPESLSVAVGATVEARCQPLDGSGRALTNRNCNWYPRDTSVAKVTGSGTKVGKITGLKAGTTWVIASATKKKDSVHVNVGGATVPPSDSPPTAPQPPTGTAPILLAAGDIADCDTGDDEETAKLLDAYPNATVLTLGDNAYEDGTSTEFQNCYGPSWGRHKSRTRPTPGNHEYHTSGASGYFGYFGANAGSAGKGYYSYDVGDWHIVALNSNISMAAGSDQEKWLRADLAANPKQCTLAYWHHPRFSSGKHGNSSSTAPLWQALYEAGAELVLSGHDHSYERFAPQNPSGAADPDKGIRQFVVGTGGRSHYAMVSKQPNSELYNGSTFGVMKLSLGADSYSWEFLPVAGASFTDKGTGSCHGANGGGSAPPPPADTTPAPPPPPPTGGALPVFPSAEGFGIYTRAGRGGQIIRVTNLNDAGSGSLRAAIAASGPRTVVFEVSGTIRLTSNLEVENPFITIAGQTAPSPGITLRGAGLIVETNDVLIQHIRIRTGDDPSGPSPSSRDAIRLHGGSGVYNVVVDHVSASWAIDENGGTSTSNTRRDLTMSNMIISEGLHNSLHSDGPHSKGVLYGQGTQRMSLIRSVLAHNYDRNPWFKGGTSGVVVNNVIYDWGNGKATYFDKMDSSGPDLGAVVGNVYIKGASTPSDAVAIKVYSQNSGSKFYVSDNTLNRNAAPSNAWSLVENEAGSGVIASSPPIWPERLNAWRSSETEALVLANAGARPADRDAVDARIVNQVRTGSGRIIDSQNQVGGWPALAQNTRAFAAPANPDGDDDGDGYTNLEEVLHSMAAAVEGR